MLSVSYCISCRLFFPCASPAFAVYDCADACGGHDEQSDPQNDIAAVAACLPLLTPKAEGTHAVHLYLCGRTEEDERELRRQILHTTKAELIDLSHALDKLFESAGVCVIGSQNAIAACADKLSD